MSRPYYNYSNHRTKSDGHATFPITVLLACIIWTHKVAMTRVEYLITVVAIISLPTTTKLVIKTRQYRRLHSSSMASMDNITGLEFEKYVAKLLKCRGYKHVRLTEKYDLGVDIIAEKDGIRWGIQVKRYSGLVKTDAVRQVVTALRSYNCDRAMVITNNSFSQTAKELASSNDCVLVDRSILMKWPTW